MWRILALLCLLSFVLGQQLPVDKDGRISANLLLIRATAPKAWQKLVGIGRTTVLVTDSSYFASDKIVAACIWKGFPVEYIADR
jgi:hypothetical protein